MSKHDTPKCSHCGTGLEHDELWSDSDIYKDDGDYSEVRCKNLDCGKTFYVQCSHEMFFTQVDEESYEIN